VRAKVFDVVQPHPADGEAEEADLQVPRGDPVADEGWQPEEKAHRQSDQSGN